MSDISKVEFRCTKCNALMGKCDCWVKCSCGWSAEKGKSCRNPETTQCSTKVNHKKNIKD